MTDEQPPPAALLFHVEFPRVVLVDCPSCGAVAGGSCRDGDALRLANHAARARAIAHRIDQERFAAKAAR